MKGSQQGQLGNLNRYNQSRIINCLWDAKKATRHYLSHETGLSIPTISHALISLTKEHLVQVETEKTTGKRGGRPAEWFYFSGSENFAIGIDLEKEISFCLLADLEGNIKERISWKTPSRPTPHALITDVLKHIRRMEEKVPSGAYLRGIGIALPGLVSRYTGKVIYSHTFEWHNIEFVNAIRKEIEYPVFIDNEANLLSLGELYFGSGKNYQNFICVDIRYGIGSGVVYQHKLLDIPGELGQSCFVVGGDSELSSRFQKLEESASDHALLTKAKEWIKKSPESTMLSRYPQPLSLQHFIEALQLGDGVAVNIFKKAMDDLGKGLAFLVNMFHPEAFIFHGPITENNPLFYTEIRNVIERYSLSPFFTSFDLKPSTFNQLGGAFGGVSMILQELLALNPDLV